MTRFGGLVAVAVLCLASAAWAGTTNSSRSHRAAAAAAPPGMQEFEENSTLGATLGTRRGTDEEYTQVQTLMDRGLKAARNLMEANPQSAQAQYMLGSWLIYGYRVVTTQETTTDATGGTHTTEVRNVVQGLADEPAEGLEALGRAAELAPTNAVYTLDHAAALLDTGQPALAVGILNAAWSGKPPLDPSQKARASLMLSDAYWAQDRPGEAREWLYATLLLNPDNAEIVNRLRALDAEMASAQSIPAPSVAPAAPVEEPSEAAPAREEVAPEQEAAPEEPSDGSGEVAPSDQGDDSGAAAPPKGDSSGDAGSADDQTLQDILGEEAE